MFEILKRLPRGMKLVGSLLTGLFVVVLLVSACTPAASPAPAAPVAPEPVAAPMPVPAPEPELTPEPMPEALDSPVTLAPVLLITSPMRGSTLTAGNIEVSVSVQNFKLVALGGSNVEGEGHLHFYMDVDVPTAQGLPAVTAAGTYKVSPTTSVIWEGVGAGMHTFSVQLVNSNHTPLSTPVIAEVTVTVAAEEAPAPAMPAPEPQPAPYSYSY